MCVHTKAHIWRSEENLSLFYHVDARDQTQVVRLGGKNLFLLIPSLKNPGRYGSLPTVSQCSGVGDRGTGYLQGKLAR